MAMISKLVRSLDAIRSRFRAQIMQISVEIQLGREQSRMRIAEGTAAT